MNSLLLILYLVGQDAGDWAKERDAMKSDIGTLAIQTPWSKVQWKSCLLDACEQARKEHKPVLIWALGGDPEGRC